MHDRDEYNANALPVHDQRGVGREERVVLNNLP
jgi:hypothetical protein